MDLEKNFTYHPPTETQKEYYTTVREMAHVVAMYLENKCPQSRELSLALTKLEECVMWANAGVARNGTKE